MKKINLFFVLVLLYTGVNAQSNYVKEHFTKKEVYITMRDGVKLFTSIYIPKDASSQNKYPMMMMRTCYSIAPYGEDKYPQRLVIFLFIRTYAAAGKAKAPGPT